MAKERNETKTIIETPVLRWRFPAISVALFAVVATDLLAKNNQDIRRDRFYQQLNLAADQLGVALSQL